MLGCCHKKKKLPRAEQSVLGIGCGCIEALNTDNEGLRDPLAKGESRSRQIVFRSEAVTGPSRKALTGPVRSVLIPRAVMASRKVCVSDKAGFVLCKNYRYNIENGLKGED